MFERFTGPAREAVQHAQEEATALGHGWIGLEHLLVALAGGPDDDAAAGALRRAGTSAGDLRRAVRALAPAPALDADALAAIGIDLEQVRQRVEEAFGPGALERRRPACDRRGRGAGGGGARPFSRSAKKALELSLREATARGDRHIGSEHVLLGVLRAAPPDSVARRALEQVSVDPARLRELLAPPRAA